MRWELKRRITNDQILQQSVTNTFGFDVIALEEEKRFEGLTNTKKHIENANRQDRQVGEETRVDFDAVASSRPGAGGKRCIDKVIIKHWQGDDQTLTRS